MMNHDDQEFTEAEYFLGDHEASSLYFSMERLLNGGTEFGFNHHFYGLNGKSPTGDITQPLFTIPEKFSCNQNDEQPQSLFPIQRLLLSNLVYLNRLLSYPLFNINGAIVWLSNYKQLSVAEDFFGSSYQEGDPKKKTIMEAAWNIRSFSAMNELLEGLLPEEASGQAKTYLENFTVGIFRYVYTMRLKLLFPNDNFIVDYAIFPEEHEGILAADGGVPEEGLVLFKYRGFKPKRIPFDQLEKDIDGLFLRTKVSKKPLDLPDESKFKPLEECF